MTLCFWHCKLSYLLSTVDCVDGPGASAAGVISAVSNEATVAEAFLRMFVETCGHYDAYINIQQNGEKIFQVSIVVNVQCAASR